MRLTDMFKKKEDLLLKGILNGEHGFVGPEIVQFDITNRCNNNCMCCWNNSPLLGPPSDELKEELSAELPVELVKKTIRELQVLGTRTLFFAGGGDPFYHPHIMEILEFAKKCKMRVYMNSNFTLIDEKRAEKLVRLKIEHLHVSLLAGTSVTYAHIHPNKTRETFDKIVEVLEYIASLKAKLKQHLYDPVPHINLYYVIFNMNYPEIERMVDLALRVKADSVEFTPIDIVPGKTESLLLNPDEVKIVVKNVLAQAERLERYNVNVAVKTNITQKDSFISRITNEKAQAGIYESATVTRQQCYAGWTFVRISAKGEVHPCLKAHRISVGNIYNESFSHIWNNEAQRMFRKKTFKLDFNDPYFAMIGNDPNFQHGCLKSCDNIQINVDMDNRYREVLKKHGRIS